MASLLFLHNHKHRKLQRLGELPQTTIEIVEMPTASPIFFSIIIANSQQMASYRSNENFTWMNQICGHMAFSSRFCCCCRSSRKINFDPLKPSNSQNLNKEILKPHNLSTVFLQKHTTWIIYELRRLTSSAAIWLIPGNSPLSNINKSYETIIISK